MPLHHPIALVGLSGAGKSTVARLVAARLGVTAMDLDSEIERDAGLPIPELFARDGEAAFRRRESQALERAVAASAGVIACGGGIVETEAARGLLRQRCQVVWLEVEPGVASARVQVDGEVRPLLGAGAPPERMSALLARRAAWYAELASVRIGTVGLSAEAVAERVVKSLAHDAAAGDGR